jgi:hypothetical protein
MKKTIYKTIMPILILMLFSFEKKYSQSSGTGVAGFSNAPVVPGTGLDFLGWALGTQVGGVLATGGTLIIPDLTIKTEDPMPISFYTNAGNGGFSNLRMWIKDDGGGTTTTDSRNNDGFVGIGDFSTFTGSSTTPQELLHLISDRNDLQDVFEQFTNVNTGHSAKRGLLVGLQDAPNYIGGLTNFAARAVAKIIQEEDAPLKFYTLDSARMIINSNYNPMIHSVLANTNGYVGIGLPNFWDEESGIFPTNAEGPRSLLHMQGPYNAFNNGGDGWRKWMKTGIYMNENSDEIYVGLKNEIDQTGHTNRSDAVIM